MQIDRTAFDAADVVRDIWESLELPRHALDALKLPGEDDPALPSSFKIGILAQATVALSALAAALTFVTRSGSKQLPQVEVSQLGAVIEFKSALLFTLHWLPTPSPKSPPLGGLYQTSDGYIRLHDAFPHHILGTLKLLGVSSSANRGDIARAILKWKSVDLETVGTAEGRLANYALRSYGEWDVLPQSRAISNNPVVLQQVTAGPPKALPSTQSKKCLHGLRVVEMSRVIAAPVSGMTLAAHGADVLWVTSYNLPNLPQLDRNFSRGKRKIELDLNQASDKERLMELLKTCDVFIQSYRPGSLAASFGLSAEELARINPNIICANLSAFGPSGPWANRRGFDSLVQTCSGMNVSEAEHAGEGEPARVMPCQALDYSSGYLLATGIMAALHHRATRGGAWRVDVLLAGAMKYLRSLGQYPGATGFQAPDYHSPEDVPEELFETKETGVGLMTAIKHTPIIEGCEIGWDAMPKPYGSDRSDRPEWQV
jgi:crotonobetainyl-CoA:carnitine CoA-transferase CaiB-like acyl-CoA transferase